MMNRLENVLGNRGGTTQNKLAKVRDAIEEFARDHGNSKLETECKGYRRTEEVHGTLANPLGKPPISGWLEGSFRLVADGQLIEWRQAARNSKEPFAW